jgi:Flp pilus assembly protein TadB
MAHAIPPELLTPEDRDLRVAELEWQIGREWLRYAVTEAVVLFLPFAVVLVLYIADTVSFSAVLVTGVVVLLAMCVLVVYWLRARIRPLQRELEAIRSLQ